MKRLALLTLLALAGSPLLGCSAIVDVSDYEIEDEGGGDGTVTNKDAFLKELDGQQFNTGCTEADSEEDAGLEYVYTFTRTSVRLDMIVYDYTCTYPFFVQAFEGSYEFRGDASAGVALDFTVDRRRMKLVDEDVVVEANAIALLDRSDWEYNRWISLLGVIDDAGNLIEKGDKLFIVADLSNSPRARFSLPSVGALPLDTYPEPFYTTDGDDGVDERFPDEP